MCLVESMLELLCGNPSGGRRTSARSSVGGAEGSGRLGMSGWAGVLSSVGAGEGVAAVGVAAHGPAAFVYQPVVEGAEPGGVVQAGAAAVGPPDDVVQLDDLAPAVRVGATATVTQPGAAADGGGERAGEPADVEQLTVRAEHGRDDLGVAGQPPGIGR